MLVEPVRQPPIAAAFSCHLANDFVIVLMPSLAVLMAITWRLMLY